MKGERKSNIHAVLLTHPLIHSEEGKKEVDDSPGEDSNLLWVLGSGGRRGGREKRRECAFLFTIAGKRKGRRRSISNDRSSLTK